MPNGSELKAHKVPLNESRLDNCDQDATRESIHIMGFIPVDVELTKGRATGGVIPAIEMAVRDINLRQVGKINKK
ncbi:DgyrCDS3811 [Dimorphilus gyrociliatus]|uniref:DgyrCDS3811 n=1 Tax=Dimorphilus gyrociliatus TaxID=2664684 RepID=A0A7I8VF06_9ANNE|nr:DgyrCDS3811 [Dimorphilus gyrociliatus]